MGKQTFGQMVDVVTPTTELLDDGVDDDARVAETAKQMKKKKDLYRYAKYPHEHIAIGN